MASLSQYHKRWNASSKEILKISKHVYGGHAEDHLTYIGQSNKPDHTVFLTKDMMCLALDDIRMRNEDFKSKIIELWTGKVDEFDGRFKLSTPQIHLGEPFKGKKQDGGREINFDFVYIKVKKTDQVDGQDFPFMIQTFYPII